MSFAIGYKKLDTEDHTLFLRISMKDNSYIFV